MLTGVSDGRAAARRTCAWRENSWRDSSPDVNSSANCDSPAAAGACPGYS